MGDVVGIVSKFARAYMENYCLAKGQEDADARAEKINALHRTIKDRKQVRSTHFESEMEYLQEIADDTVENDEKSHICSVFSNANQRKPYYIAMANEYLKRVDTSFVDVEHKKKVLGLFQA